MKWVVAGAVFTSAILTASESSAVNSISQATLNRRQLSDCMIRQMTASRTLSYIDASKICKQMAKVQGEGVSESSAAKPANAR